MAEMEGLYFGMGIDTSQLNSDFVDAEKTINQNIARLNKEIKLVQLHGQIELEGLDESAATAEKLRIQEDALTKQMALQEDKIIMLSAVYEHLSKTKGENAEVTKNLEMQLAREQLAMQRLEQQTKDLSEQSRIALGVQWELFSVIEPAWKGIDAAVAAGHTMPIPHAKAVAAIGAGILAVVTGSMEATEELREKNPAKVLDEDFQQAATSIDNSWRRISDSNQRGYESFNRYKKNYSNYQNNQNQELQAEIKSIKEEAGILESLAKAIGVKNDAEGNLKILPEINRNDIVRLSKVLEDYRFSEALSNAVDMWKASDSVLGKLIATLITFEYTASKAQQPIAEFAETVIQSFRELSTVASELNLPIDKANELIAKIKLAGADYNDVRDFVRGVQDAVIKGDSEDPEVLALEKYGVVIQDANGKLLAFDETLERLYQGYLKAREAGEEEAYIIMTNGQAVQDVLPYFENLAKAEEDMAKIKWATLDVATLSNASREMKLFEVQTQELNNALSSVFTPAAEMAFRMMFEDQKKLTELIEENREQIIYWSYVVMEALQAVREFRTELSEGFKNSLKETYEFLSDINEKFGLMDTLKELFAAEPKKEIGEEAREYFIPFYDELKKLEEEFGIINKFESFLPPNFTEELDNATNEYLVPFYEKIKSIKEEFSVMNKLKSMLSDFLPDGLLGGLEENLFGEDSIFARAQKDFEEYKKANEEARQEAKKTAEDLAGLSYSLNRIARYKSELQNIKLDIEFGSGDSYQKKIEQNKIWYEQAMRDAKQYADEIAIIEEVNSAKLERIEQERANKLTEIRESVALADKTALQQKLAAIEKEKQAWLQAGMEEAEAEQLAQQQKANYISGINQQLSDELNSLGQTDLQRKLSQIEQEKKAWIQKGADEEQAERLAQEKIRQAHEETETKLNEIRQSVAALDNTEIENRIAAIEREKNEWIQLGMEKAEAEELAQRKILKTVNDYEKQRAKAEKQYAEQVAQAQKQYIAQVQAAREEADRKNRQERNEALNAMKSEGKEIEAFLKGGFKGLQNYRYNELIKSGVNPEHLKKMTPELMDEYRAAQEKADRSFLPSWRDRNSPKYVEPPKVEMPDILMEVPPSFDKVSSSANNAAENLDKLARSAGYKPMEGVDGINDIRAYERPDGSIFITNSPQYLKDDIKNATSALNELPTNIKDAAKEIQNVETTQIPEVEPTEIPEIDSSVISESIQSLSAMPEAVQVANESLNEVPQAVLGVMEQLTENNLSEVEQSLSQLPTVIQTVSESLSGLPTIISGLKENLATEITQLFSPMTETLSEVTVRINDFATSLEDFLQKLINSGTTAEQRTPVNVTNNVSIEEAHAWDYDHIQELAEQVADVLKPEILSAIGGDSNSY